MPVGPLWEDVRPPVSCFSFLHLDGATAYNLPPFHRSTFPIRQLISILPRYHHRTPLCHTLLPPQHHNPLVAAFFITVAVAAAAATS